MVGCQELLKRPSCLWRGIPSKACPRESSEGAFTPAWQLTVKFYAAFHCVHCDARCLRLNFNFFHPRGLYPGGTSAAPSSGG